MTQENLTRRALLSVSDKTGLVEFAKQLADLEFELIATGGTASLLKKNQPSKTIHKFCLMNLIVMALT